METDEAKKSPIQLAFEQVDEDGSGYLDREEVRTVVEMFMGQMSDDDLDEAMAALDESGDGQVDFPEFRKYWFENLGTGGGLLKGIMSTFETLEEVPGVAYNPERYIDSDDEYRARIHALFAMIDRDHDLTLDAAEFAKFLTHKGVEPPRDLERQFEKFDTNGNGTIDKDELAGVVKGMRLDEIVPSAEEAALYMITARKNELRRLKQKNPAVYGHPVWEKRYEFPDLNDGKGLTRDELDKFREVFSMCDPTHVGYMGHRQFTDMLNMLGIEVDDETLKQMFIEMDENDDGEIDFEEFVPAMFHHISMDDLAAVDDIQIGALGTRMWSRGEILWAANTGLLLISSGVVIAGIVHFQFILVPLSVSYFMVFLLSPIMSLFEHRPIRCKGAAICDPYEPNPEDPTDKKYYKSESRREMGDTAKGSCYDCATMCKMPHGAAVLLTIITVFAGLGSVSFMVYNELKAVTDDKVFMDKLETFIDDLYADLNASGIKVLRDETPGSSSAEIAATIGAFGDVFNQAALIFLLTVYIISEKLEERMFPGETGIMVEIETMTTGYISLKTILSFLTGAVVAVIMLILQVKLAVMWGILSFLLNYIPNVGSMIAMFLPMPIVIVDDNLETWQKIGAFLGPGCVQGYVGNALEPMVFGKSLNMTPLSILAALVAWSSVWGILGAILSVPLLGIQKICLSHANHPLAKTVLAMIREDPTIDELAEIESASGVKMPGESEKAAEAEDAGSD
jgi:predicted PurR-regulated permease PerM/Ca2+-binding EF-hand superfamily protein